MAIFKFSNAGGFGTFQRYNDFLAGNPAVVLDNGSMVPLGIFTLAADQSEVEFTNIPQTTFTHLQIRGIARDTQASGAHSLRLQFNGAASNYSYHAITGDGSSTPSAGALTGQTTQFPGFIPGTSFGTGTFGAFIIDVLDYRNTNKNKVTRALSGADNNGSGNIGFFSGAWLSTNAITSIKLLPAASTNFTVNSTFALYGVSV